jgi:hypothetical protein
MLRAKDNPFAVHRVHQIRYNPPDASWDDLLTRLAALQYRGAIVGACGAGKTTMSEDLQTRLERQGRRCRRLFISLDIRLRWRDISPILKQNSEVLIVDGADHLNGLTWQRLKRGSQARGLGLVVTTHRPGRLPTWYHCRTSPELLKTIVGRLSPARQPSSTHIEALYHHHQGNIRDALRHLYDLATDSA